LNTETHDSKQKRLRRLATALVSVVAVFTTLLAVWFGRAKSRKRRDLPFDPAKLQGLSQVEAESRHEDGQCNVMETHPPRTTREIIHGNTISLFNLNLVALALVQVGINQWLGALASLGTMAFNIALTTGEELFSQRKLRPLVDEARPIASVIRDGKVQSVDPDDLVRGDVVVVGIGDQLYVDGTMIGRGRLLIDHAFGRRQRGATEKRSGDRLFAGSYCIEGRGAFRVTAIGERRRAATQLATQQDRPLPLTPL
jgi:cation-transporting ATPase E